MSQFAFLAPEWSDLFEAAAKAEALVYPDARASCFYARRALEIAVAWLYRNDRTLRSPYQEHLSALIHEPTFRALVGPAVFSKARLVKELGNQAVHSTRPVRQYDAVTALRELFHVGFWLARTYARGAKPDDGLAFQPDLLPRSGAAPAQTLAQIQALEESLAARDARVSALVLEKTSTDAELARLRDEVAKAKAANAATQDQHDYSEADTRRALIDVLLREAGWPVDRDGHDVEYAVDGMSNAQGKGRVDYVLWGDDGLPLGLVEAKKTTSAPEVGRQQAKLYADCLEMRFGRRPVIYYSNGYEHWFWDDANYPPRPVQGFHTKDELDLLIQRRTIRKPLAAASPDDAIVNRYFQIGAIRQICEEFESRHMRKALVVMATGAGKTRTVVALCDLLMRCNWVRRVLFLADRTALVSQAVKTFKAFLPDTPPKNLVTDEPGGDRVFVSTYQTMMRLIDEARDGKRSFGIGHFDLVIIDEAHRSVYQKYGAIFDYFDSFLVGLTATPKEDVDHNTYKLFDLEDGVPTSVYGLKEAVRDGFLVPLKAVSVPLRFQREGIRYDDLSEGEKDAWDALEWSEDGAVPDEVGAEAVNKWLFNEDTVDKALAHLMTRGQKVAGGDRLGKTIIFAKNHAHAEFIAARFDKSYPHYKGAFARVIDYQVEYAQTLIDSFEKANEPPHIAISVDMLDTGIDVHEVVNLVFFKIVRSKTKFWQMVGRGTRLCPDLFGPGDSKQFFYVFDFCQNLEFFSQNPETIDGAAGASLGARLFGLRVELVGALDELARKAAAGGPARAAEPPLRFGDAKSDAEVRSDVAALLHRHVAAMNLDNFIVRPRRRIVERFAKPEAWIALSESDHNDLANEVAGLPTGLPGEDEEAKRFDLLLLRLELSLLRSDSGFERLRAQVLAIAGLLEEKSSIPMVQAQMALIQEIQTDAFWQDLTTPLLERVRNRLRGLVKLIEKAKRKPVYTDFQDEIGEGAAVEMPEFGVGGDFERFRAKARRFLREHEDHITIHKLRMNKPLTPTDIGELERLLVASGVGTAADLDRAKKDSQGLGLFIRSLIGLDRTAAKEAFGQFLTRRAASANQIEFVNLIVDHLTEHGTMEAARLYESPFTDINPRGPEGVFPSADVDKIVSMLEEIRRRAAV